MATETAQLLSAALEHAWHDFHQQHGLYRRPPSGQELWRWAARTAANFSWLAEHGAGLVHELDHRGLCPGKLLAPRRIIELAYLPSTKVGMGGRCTAGGANSDHLDPPVNRAKNERDGLDFTHLEDVHLAYREYLAARWRLEDASPEPHRRPRWTNRHRPAWALN